MNPPAPAGRLGAEADAAPRPTKSLFVRTAIMAASGVILALGLFVLLIVPTQKDMLRARLESTAEVIATSIGQIAVTSIVAEDFSPVIEHCMQVVRERDVVRSIAIARRDGFALVHTRDGWRYERGNPRWLAPAGATAQFSDSELAGEAILQYTYPLSYSGSDWGWVHIGLSRARYDHDLRETYRRTALLGGLCLAAASLVSLFFARRLSRPIKHLSQVSQLVAAGNLSARAHVTTGDEVESLARSFNRMTETLQQAQVQLEQRVCERTAELQQANLVLHQEVVERRRAEEARREAERELEAQRAASMHSDRLRSLGEMAAGIAHELNQPLMGIRALAEHILIGVDRGWSLDDEELKSRMTRILEQTDRMVHIIEHVRMFAREAGRPERVRVDVDEVAGNAIDLLAAQFRSHGLELLRESGAGLPPVLANAYSLEEVVLNLLNNARDAVQEAQARGGRPVDSAVRVRVRVEATAGGDRVQVEVVDGGIGIPAEILPKVFDPFFSTKEPNKGTGLGLAVSRSIVEEFGGVLRLVSDPGVGTRAIIDLPAAPPEG